MNKKKIKLAVKISMLMSLARQKNKKTKINSTCDKTENIPEKHEQMGSTLLPAKITHEAQHFFFFYIINYIKLYIWHHK